MTWLIIGLLTQPAFAACPSIQTLPEDGETDVPPELAYFWVGTLGFEDGVISERDPCLPDSVVVEDSAGQVLAEREGGGRSVLLAPLSADTDYTATITRFNGESWTVAFRTGAPRAAAAPPVPSVVDVSAASNGERICSAVTVRIEGTDRWSVVEAGVGRPTPWTRSSGGVQTMRFATQDTASSNRLAGPSKENCFGVMVTAVDGTTELVGACAPIESVPLGPECPYREYRPPVQACRTAPGPVSLFGAGLVLAAAALRRRRRRS